MNTETTLPRAKALGIDFTSAEYGYQVSAMDEVEHPNETSESEA